MYARPWQHVISGVYVVSRSQTLAGRESFIWAVDKTLPPGGESLATRDYPGVR